MPILGFKHLTTQQEDILLRSIIDNAPTPAPFSIELQPTNKCNVDCFFCSSKPFRNDEFIPWDKLERELRTAAAHGLRFIRLSGGGESLVYSNLRELLDLMKELGLRLSDVTTNATALPPVAERLVDVGLDDASISLNEPNAPLWAKTMRAPERLFAKCIEGIERLVTARDATPADQRPHIQLKFMVYKGNFRELRAMYDLGRRLQVDQVMLNELIGLDASERMSSAEINEAKEYLREIITEDCAHEKPVLSFSLGAEGDLQSFAMELAVSLLPERFAPIPAASERIHYCLMGWYHTTIAATGVIYPCCNFVGLPNKHVGNLHEQSLGDIWAGSDYQRYRSEFRELMLLGGKVEFSAKRHRYLAPYCIEANACPFSWGLCRDSFYRQVSDELDNNVSSSERFAAAGKNNAIKFAHRVLAAVRS